MVSVGAGHEPITHDMLMSLAEGTASDSGVNSISLAVRPMLYPAPVDLNIEHVLVGNIHDIGPGATSPHRELCIRAQPARDPRSVVIGPAGDSLQLTEEATPARGCLSMVKLDSARHRCH